jgi:hypothetical protein
VRRRELSELKSSPAATVKGLLSKHYPQEKYTNSNQATVKIMTMMEGIYENTPTIDDDGKHVEISWKVTRSMLSKPLRDIMFPPGAQEEEAAPVDPQPRPLLLLGPGANTSV